MRSAMTSAKLPLQGRARDSDSREVPYKNFPQTAVDSPLLSMRKKSSLFARFRNWLDRFQRLTATLVSAVFHLAFLLILALLATWKRKKGAQVLKSSRTGWKYPKKLPLLTFLKTRLKRLSRKHRTMSNRLLFRLALSLKVNRKILLHPPSRSHWHRLLR